MAHPRVSSIAAIGKNRELGRGNDLLWRIPGDLKQMRQRTEGHTLIMGRKTFESIIEARKTPLPNRTSIVITRSTAHNPNFDFPNVILAHSMEDALAKARAVEPEEIFIFGGAQIYAEAMPFVDRLYLTLIDATENADTFFPPYEHLFTRKVSEQKEVWDGLAYTLVILEK